MRTKTRIGITLAALIATATMPFGMQPAQAGQSGGSPAMLASAAIQSVDGESSTASNRCGFRTSATPGSWWIASFAQPYCDDCPAVAAAYAKANPRNYYYCTYNPSNDLSDLHGHRR